MAAVLGRRAGTLEAGRWRLAVKGALALLGAATGFLVLNVLIGVATVLAVRTFTPAFLSVYVLNDLALLGLSLLQGLVFGLWYGGSRRERG